jgi:mannitol/fructose-specific phosphotransferase system IIA component (Ntr-type)
VLKDFLQENITVIESVHSWEESIQVAAESLLKKNYITSNYVDSMINSINVNGSYVIIIPSVAMPHSRPENGVNQTVLSLLKLNTPVIYPQNKEVNLVLILAAKDNDAHMKLIGELCELLGNQNKIDKIIKSKTVEEIRSILY